MFDCRYFIVPAVELLQACPVIAPLSCFLMLDGPPPLLMPPLTEKDARRGALESFIGGGGVVRFYSGERILFGHEHIELGCAMK